MSNVVPITIEGYDYAIENFDKAVKKIKLKHNKAAAKRSIVTRNYTVRREDVDEFLGLIKPYARTFTNVEDKTFKWHMFKFFYPILKIVYKLFNVDLVDFDKIKTDRRLFDLHRNMFGQCECAHMYILPMIGVVKDKIIINPTNKEEIELI